MMRRRTLLRMGLSALGVAACATPTPNLSGPGLVFVYTDN
ncbi:MAG: hypothetical protein RI985_2001 [Chloroflexota bacterium]|jgi:hypothetical protein